jgi:hypothetical protein
MLNEGQKQRQAFNYRYKVQDIGFLEISKIKLRSGATSLFDVRRSMFDVGRSSFSMLDVHLSKQPGVR